MNHKKNDRTVKTLIRVKEQRLTWVTQVASSGFKGSVKVNETLPWKLKVATQVTQVKRFGVCWCWSLVSNLSASIAHTFYYK